MKVTEYLKNAKSTLISFEILPPVKGKGIQSLYEVLDPLMEFKPPFINVTYHRAEYTYKNRKDGFLEKVEIRKRPGTVGICAAIKYKYKIDAVPHLTCGGFTMQETEDALIDLRYLNIDNVLLIRGDPASNEKVFIPENGGHRYAVDIVKQVVELNNGNYLEEEITNGYKSDFCIGVAGYPEKHYEAPNLQFDLKYLKSKVDAGADYITTQMFFDNKKYFEFVEACKELKINVPIIPGLKSITTKKQVITIPSVFHVDIPEDLYTSIEKCKDDDEAEQVGIEWTIQQAKELIKYGVPCIHFYTMSKAEPIVKIVRGII